MYLISGLCALMCLLLCDVAHSKPVDPRVVAELTGTIVRTCRISNTTQPVWVRVFSPEAALGPREQRVRLVGNTVQWISDSSTSVAYLIVDGYAMTLLSSGADCSVTLETGVLITGVIRTTDDKPARGCAHVCGHQVFTDEDGVFRVRIAGRGVCVVDVYALDPSIGVVGMRKEVSSDSDADLGILLLTDLTPVVSSPINELYVSLRESLAWGQVLLAVSMSRGPPLKDEAVRKALDEWSTATFDHGAHILPP